MSDRGLNSDEEAEKLAHDPERLERWLRGRLVRLAAGDSAYAIRAIEMLFDRPLASQNRNLSHLSTNTLEEAYRRAFDWINSLESGGDDESGTQPPPI